MWPFRKKTKFVVEAKITEQPEPKLPEIDKEAVALLCPDIQSLLDAELKAKNQLRSVEYSDWPMKNCILVVMQNPFWATIVTDNPDVPFYATDPHGNGDSYYCKEHNQVLLAPLKSNRRRI